MLTMHGYKYKLYGLFSKAKFLFYSWHMYVWCGTDVQNCIVWVGYSELYFVSQMCSELCIVCVRCSELCIVCVRCS